MSEAIRIIEMLGMDSELRHADHMQIERALKGAELSILIKSAVVDSDATRIQNALGARAVVNCLVLPSKPNEQDEEEKDDDEKDAPDKDDESAIRRSFARVVSIR